MTAIKPTISNYIPTSITEKDKIWIIANGMVENIEKLKNAAKSLKSNTSVFEKKCNKAITSLGKIMKYPQTDYSVVALAKLGHRTEKICTSSKFAALRTDSTNVMNKVDNQLKIAILDLSRLTLEHN
ncbi:hypothetical protein GA565_20255 [Rouxiella sp. S1S-2]|uniref:hypothetical protein n=1 Tax=Rouxiella sp. S1S-2 TaxID=2653856 RepID=UPI00126422A9|nr:hypothetical protein [Rouxiella sp. S1S-2]KAB7898118.1 hypothetical protein GA565_20255 [Rouxiella sp. S1S-2]